MHTMTRLTALALIATLTVLPTAQAGNGENTGSNESQTFSVVGAYMSALLVVGSITLPVLVVKDSATASTSHRAEKQRAEKAEKETTALEVTAIHTANGKREVQLREPGNDANGLTLQWDAVADHDPTAVFHVGQPVTVRASAGGSGWNLLDNDGTVLAFAPGEAAAAQVKSGTW